MYLGLLHRAAAGQVSSVTGAAGRLIAATALGVAAGLSKETAAPLLLVPVAWQAWTWTWSVDADDEQEGRRGGRLRQPAYGAALPLLSAVLSLAGLTWLRVAAVGKTAAGGMPASMLVPATAFEWVDAPLLVEAALEEDVQVAIALPSAPPYISAANVSLACARLANLPVAPASADAAHAQRGAGAASAAGGWTRLHLGPSHGTARRIVSSLLLLGQYVSGLVIRPWPARALLRSEPAWRRSYAYDYSPPAWQLPLLGPTSRGGVILQLALALIATPQQRTATLLLLVLLAGTAHVAAQALRRGCGTRAAARLWWCIALLAGLVLPSQALQALGFCYADRVMYIPSAAAAALASDAFFSLLPPHAAPAVATCVAAAWLVSARAHSEDWRSDGRLMLSALHGPGAPSIKVAFNAALVLSDLGSDLGGKALQKAATPDAAGTATARCGCQLKREAARLYAFSAGRGPDYVLGWKNAGLLEAECAGDISVAAALWAEAIKVDCYSGYSRHRVRKCLREVIAVATLLGQTFVQAARNDEPPRVRRALSQLCSVHCARLDALLFLQHAEKQRLAVVESRILQPDSPVPNWRQEVNGVSERCLVRAQSCPEWHRAATDVGRADLSRDATSQGPSGR